MCVLVTVVVLVGLWVGYHFVRGFIQGFCEGWQQTQWRHLKGVWRQCQRENSHQDL